jgi:cell division protein FtsI/penicillin-binding protein 2
LAGKVSKKVTEGIKGVQRQIQQIGSYKDKLLQYREDINLTLDAELQRMANN